MRSGSLNETIVIESKSSSPNEYGEPEETWSTHATVRANVRQLTASQRFQGAGELSKRISMFKIRYLSTLAEEMRISYDGFYWDIMGIAETKRGREMEITAEAYKGLNDGP